MLLSLQLLRIVAAQTIRNCTTGADCESFLGDEDCVALPTTGAAAKYCVPSPPPVGTPDRCSPSGGPGPTPACCNSTACTAKPGGTCSAPVSCGGAPPLPGGATNKCYYDACTLAPDGRRLEEANPDACLKGEVCVPGGFGEMRGYPRNFCAKAGCAADADCDEEGMTAGACTAFLGDFRCGDHAIQGFYCSYKESPCRVDKDCSMPDICVYNTTSMAPQCQRPLPPPPVWQRHQRAVEQ
jgi:hypothetical protein